MLSGVRHGFAIEEPTEDLDRLGEPGLADRWWIEVLADGLVLAEGVARSDPNFEATPAQMVQAGELLGQMDRVVKVIVQHKRADAESRRAFGDSHQRYERRPPINHVIPGVHHVETGFLSGLGMRPQIICGALRYLEAKAKWTHEERLRAGAQGVPVHPCNAGLVRS